MCLACFPMFVLCLFYYTRELIFCPEIINRFTASAISAILGAAVADAATRPLHWIYR